MLCLRLHGMGRWKEFPVHFGSTGCTHVTWGVYWWGGLFQDTGISNYAVSLTFLFLWFRTKGGSPELNPFHKLDWQWDEDAAMYSPTKCCIFLHCSTGSGEELPLLIGVRRPVPWITCFSFSFAWTDIYPAAHQPVGTHRASPSPNLCIDSANWYFPLLWSYCI